jgi:hypothetical protein
MIVAAAYIRLFMSVMSTSSSSKISSITPFISSSSSYYYYYNVMLRVAFRLEGIILWL